jgi:hypothetical protein
MELDYDRLREFSPTIRMFLGLWGVVRSRMEVEVFSDLVEMVRVACREVDGNGISWRDVWLGRVYRVVRGEDGNIVELKWKLRVPRGCSKLTRYLLGVETKPLLAFVRIEYGSDGLVPIRIRYLVWSSELVPKELIRDILDKCEWDIQTYTD